MPERRRPSRDSLPENRWYHINVLLLLRRQEDGKTRLLCQIETGRSDWHQIHENTVHYSRTEVWAAASHLSGCAVHVSDNHSDVMCLCCQVTASEKDMKPLGRSHLRT